MSFGQTRKTASRFSDFARAGKDEDFYRGASAWDWNRGGDPRHEPNPTLGARLKNRRSTRCRSRPEALVPRVAPALMNAQKSFGLTAVPSKASTLPATSWPTRDSKGVGAGTTLGPASHGDISPYLNAAAG